jgi:hypothetical protein
MKRLLLQFPVKLCSTDDCTFWNLVSLNLTPLLCRPTPVKDHPCNKPEHLIAVDGNMEAKEAAFKQKCDKHV